MPNFNSIQVMGHAGGDPELRTTQKGTSVASFSVAVKDNFNKEHTEWFRVSVFGKSAENFVMPYLKKGDIVLVQGSAKVNVYSSKTGDAKGNIEIMANEIQIISSRDSKPEQKQEQPNQDQQAASFEEDSIPF